MDVITWTLIKYIYTGCAKINYARLAGHDKSYIGPILKIYDLIVSRKPELDSRIFCKFFYFQFLELQASFLKFSFSKTLKTIKKHRSSFLKNRYEWTKRKHFRGDLGFRNRLIVSCFMRVRTILGEM